MGFVIIIIIFICLCFVDASNGDMSSFGMFFKGILYVLLFLGIIFLLGSCGS